MNIDGNVVRRFLSNVAGTVDGCWLWTARTKVKGYGRMKVGDRHEMAHRISWVIHRGPIPEGLFVLHRCVVRGCVNPSHLYLGTHADNMRDVQLAGSTKGRKNGNSKLTPRDVVEIRDKRACGFTLQSIADQYGISNQQVHRVCTDQWRHIPMHFPKAKPKEKK